MSLDLLPLHTVAIILVVLFPLSSLAFPYENKCLAVDYENGGKIFGETHSSIVHITSVKSEVGVFYNSSSANASLNMIWTTLRNSGCVSKREEKPGWGTK